ncbi:hypothetical protein Pmar_PMAR006304, partial [Perkinsus marinus ATCC 50983]
MFRMASSVALRARARMMGINGVNELPRGYVPRPGMKLPQNLRRIQGSPVLPGVHLPIPAGEAVERGAHAVCTHAQSSVGTLVEIGDGRMMIPKVRVELNEDGIFTVRKDTFDDPATVREAREELLGECEKLAACDSKFALKWVQALARCDAKDLHWMPDALAEILTISDEEKVSLLEERSLVARARRVGDIIRGKIGDGEKNREDIDQLIDLGRKIPLGNTGDRTRRVFEKELTRLSQLEPSSQEYA